MVRFCRNVGHFAKIMQLAGRMTASCSKNIPYIKKIMQDVTRRLYNRHCLLSNRRCLLTNRRCLLTNRRCLLTNRHCLLTNRRCLLINGRCLLTNRRCLLTNRHGLLTSRRGLLANRRDLLYSRRGPLWNRRLQIPDFSLFTVSFYQDKPIFETFRLRQELSVLRLHF